MSRMTEPDVFIIESLKLKDKKDQDFEGQFLSQILHLGGKEPIYTTIFVRRKAQENTEGAQEKQLPVPTYILSWEQDITPHNVGWHFVFRVW